MDASEIDQELEALGTKVEQLRALYEQYFMGLERIEPLVIRKDVERRVRVLRREQLRNTAQRFKFNTLVQRLNTMGTYWGRIVREIENGTYRRDVIRAAARFGEGALAVLGKKKTKDLVAAVAQAQQKRPVDDAFELGADDLIEEEEDDDTDVPTPPRLDRVSIGAGLGQGDLPVVGAFAAPVPVGPVAATPAPRQVAPATLGTLPQPTAPSKRLAGLRWGASAPVADAAAPVRTADVTRRVADLAAQLGAPRSDQGKAAPASFGELDLDFDEPAGTMGAPLGPPLVRGPSSAPRPPGRPAPAPAPTAPLPQPAALLKTPARPLTAAPSQPSSGGFGELDLSLEAAPTAPVAPVARPNDLRPAPAAANRPVQGPKPPIAPSPAASGSELPDQRIRQIYAKYVEAKRSTQESTAGVTFEKLAASLRAQADKLKSAHPHKSIDYEVVVKDGKTHLKPVLR